MKARTTSRQQECARARAIVGALAVVLSLSATSVEAVENPRRWSVGFRVGDYLPADQQGGGFRVSNEVFAARTENPVKLDEVPTFSFVLGRDVKTWTGAKRWTNTTLSLELDV